MTGPAPERDPCRPPVDSAALRRRLAALADTIAWTEDRVADTLERLALTRPRDAPRLLERAASARKYATVERDRAVLFREPAPPRSGR
jgi:hypothetical protein